MTVGELIHALQALDPSLEVVSWPYDGQPSEGCTAYLSIPNGRVMISGDDPRTLCRFDSS